MASPVAGGTGKFILAVAIVFVPLVVLSDFAPNFAVLMAVAAAAVVAFKFGPAALANWGSG